MRKLSMKREHVEARYINRPRNFLPVRGHMKLDEEIKGTILTQKNFDAKTQNPSHLDLCASFELRLCMRGDAGARGRGGVIGSEGLVGLGTLVEAVLLWRRDRV